MSRRLAAMVRLRQIAQAAQNAQVDAHRSSAWSHGAIALLMLLIGLGGPLVDLWFGDDPKPQVATEEDPMPWLPDAPDTWIVERVDLPAHREPLDVWKKIPVACSDHPTCID